MGSSYTWEYAESIWESAFPETIAFIVLLSLFPHCWWVFPFHEHLFLSTFMFLNSFYQLVRNKPRRALLFCFPYLWFPARSKVSCLILLGSILSKCLHSLNMPLRQWPICKWLVITQIKPLSPSPGLIAYNMSLPFPFLGFFFFLNFILKSETFNTISQCILNLR